MNYSKDSCSKKMQDSNKNTKKKKTKKAKVTTFRVIVITLVIGLFAIVLQLILSPRQIIPLLSMMKMVLKSIRSQVVKIVFMQNLTKFPNIFKKLL